METPLVQEFKILDKATLATVKGGKTTYYGNGLYCSEIKCWVNWSQTVNTIINNSVMNGLTEGKAGWHSGGVI